MTDFQPTPIPPTVQDTQRVRDSAPSHLSSLPMNALYYTLKAKKSLKTLRIEYGQLGLKFVLRMFEGQIDRSGEREGLPKEILFEGEKELLKQIHEIKKELKDSEWSEREFPCYQPTI